MDNNERLWNANYWKVMTAFSSIVAVHAVGLLLFFAAKKKFFLLRMARKQEEISSS